MTAYSQRDLSYQPTACIAHTNVMNYFYAKVFKKTHTGLLVWSLGLYNTRIAFFSYLNWELTQVLSIWAQFACNYVNKPRTCRFSQTLFPLKAWEKLLNVSWNVIIGNSIIINYSLCFGKNKFILMDGCRIIIMIMIFRKQFPQNSPIRGNRIS